MQIYAVFCYCLYWLQTVFWGTVYFLREQLTVIGKLNISEFVSYLFHLVNIKTLAVHWDDVLVRLEKKCCTCVLSL